MVASNADFDGQESVAADSIAADSVITVRTKNTCQGETASRPLFELVERQEWRLCMLKMQTEPHQARFHGTISIAGQMTHAYPLHLAVSKKPPTHLIDCLIKAFPDALRATDQKYGRLPLHIACIHTASAQVLKRLLVGFEEATRFADKAEGRLPVHYACVYGSPFEIAVLVEAEDRALIYKDLSGKTPLDLAQNSSNPHRDAIIRRLEENTQRMIDSVRQRRRQSGTENAPGDTRPTLSTNGTSEKDKRKNSKLKPRQGVADDSLYEDTMPNPPLDMKKSAIKRSIKTEPSVDLSSADLDRPPHTSIGGKTSDSTHNRKKTEISENQSKEETDLQARPVLDANKTDVIRNSKKSPVSGEPAFDDASIPPPSALEPKKSSSRRNQKPDIAEDPSGDDASMSISVVDKKKNSSRRSQRMGLSEDPSVNDTTVPPQPNFGRKNLFSRRSKTLSKERDHEKEPRPKLPDNDVRKNTFSRTLSTDSSIRLRDNGLKLLTSNAEEKEKQQRKNLSEEKKHSPDDAETKQSTKNVSMLNTSEIVPNEGAAATNEISQPGLERSCTAPVNTSDGNVKLKSEKRILSSVPTSTDGLSESHRARRRSSKKQLSTSSSKSFLKSSRKFSELSNSQAVEPSASSGALTTDNISRNETLQIQPTNSHILERFLRKNAPSESSSEHESDQRSKGAVSLPAHFHSQRMNSALLRAGDPDDEFLVQDQVRAMSLDDETGKNEFDTTVQAMDAAQGIASMDADLFKLEAQIRNLDLRKEALSHECTQIYKSVANKQDDVDKSRDKIISIQRKLADYQAKLEKEQASLELAVSSIAIQRETLGEHESKLDMVENDRKLLWTRKEHLLEERRSKVKAKTPISTNMAIALESPGYPVFDI